MFTKYVVLLNVGIVCFIYQKEVYTASTEINNEKPPIESTAGNEEGTDELNPPIFNYGPGITSQSLDDSVYESSSMELSNGYNLPLLQQPVSATSTTEISGTVGNVLTDESVEKFLRSQQESLKQALENPDFIKEYFDGMEEFIEAEKTKERIMEDEIIMSQLLTQPKILEAVKEMRDNLTNIFDSANAEQQIITQFEKFRNLLGLDTGDVPIVADEAAS